MKITKRTTNSIANIASRLWSMLSTIIFLPLYLAYLGEDAYGLVTLFATLQAAMSLLGLGLSGTLRREFSLSEKSEGNKEYKRKLLISVEIIYYLACVVGVAVCYIFSDTIANNWLADNTLPSDLVSKTITLMGVTVGLQMLSNLWHGCLLGLNHQVKANVYQILAALIKNCIAVVACYYYKSIIIYYFVFIIVDFLYCMLLRISISKYLVNSERQPWHFSDMRLVKKVWRYALGIVSISILSLFLTQIDKIILSRFLRLREIGAYNSMFTLGSLSRVISTGVAASVMTEFTQLYSAQNLKELEKRYISTWQSIACFTVCIVVYVAFFAETIVSIWTKNDFYASIAEVCAPYLMIGIGAVALQEIPYSYLLAQGKTRLNIVLGILILPFYGVSSYFGIKYYGMLGASVAYAIIFLVHTIIYFFMANKDVSNKREVNKVYASIVISIIVSISLAAITKYVTKNIDNTYLKLMLAVTSGLFSASLLLLFLSLNGKFDKLLIFFKSRGTRSS